VNPRGRAPYLGAGGDVLQRIAEQPAPLIVGIGNDPFVNTTLKNVPQTNVSVVPRPVVHAFGAMKPRAIRSHHYRARVSQLREARVDRADGFVRRKTVETPSSPGIAYGDRVVNGRLRA
jgi:hypothetical protein